MMCALLTMISPPDTDSPMDSQSVNSVESEVMKPASIPKTRPSTFPSKEFLSSLVLPAPSLLKEYLCHQADGGSGRGVDNGPIRPAALRESNLLWFSTRGTCIVKTSMLSGYHGVQLFN